MKIKTDYIVYPNLYSSQVHTKYILLLSTLKLMYKGQKRIPDQITKIVSESVTRVVMIVTILNDYEKVMKKFFSQLVIKY